MGVWKLTLVQHIHLFILELRGITDLESDCLVEASIQEEKAELKPVNTNIPVQHISNPPPFSLYSCINCDNLHQCRDRKATGSLFNSMMLFKHEVEEGCLDNGAEPLLMALLGLLTERLV